MNHTNQPIIDHQLVEHINKEVLHIVHACARHDLAKASLLFDLNKAIGEKIVQLTASEIDILSQQPLCFLSLRKAYDDEFWQQVLLSAKEKDDAYQFNLQALLLKNCYPPVQDPTESSK